MTDTSRSEVENYKPQSGLTDSEKDTLVTTANNLADDVFGGVVRTLAEVEGNEKDFKSLIAAHLWTLAEGGELQSEGQSGGSVSYNVTPGNPEEFLTGTRYAEAAQMYIRNNAQVSVEWA